MKKNGKAFLQYQYEKNEHEHIFARRRPSFTAEAQRKQNIAESLRPLRLCGLNFDAAAVDNQRDNFVSKPVREAIR
jgi:hypothetical protein